MPKKILDIANELEANGHKSRILSGVQRALGVEGHRRSIYTNEFNRRMEYFMNLNK